MGVSFSLSLTAVEHILIGDLVSNALWVLNVQPTSHSTHLPPLLSFQAAFCRQPHLLCAAALSFLCSQTCTLWVSFSRQASLNSHFSKSVFICPSSLSFPPEHLFWPPTFNSCAIVFVLGLYDNYHFYVQYMHNNFTWIPPAETLKGNECGRCWSHMRGSEYRNNSLISYYIFLCCFARRQTKYKAWRENMQRRKSKNLERTVQKGRGERTETDKMTRRWNKYNEI